MKRSMHGVGPKQWTSTRRLISGSCCKYYGFEKFNIFEYALGRGGGVIKKSTLCTLS